MYDLVCAMDVVEHAEDGDAALAELSRVTKPGGVLLLSVPLHAAQWSAFDELVGHRQRYEPAELRQKLFDAGFAVESSAVYGMQPRWRWLTDFGMRCLMQRRTQAIWYYTHLLMPIGLRLQAKLRFAKGMISSPDIAEILLVCRRY
jgi:SAM-dependent methyltransferase